MSTPGGPLRIESLCAVEGYGVGARQAGLSITTRRIHRAVLRFFLDHGQPPHRDDLGPAENVARAEGLRQLGEVDLVHLAADGRVAVAYPFSGSPTEHVVRLDGAASVYAMCAIDALGIPLMAGRDGLIESRDPDNAEPVCIERRGQLWRWSPEPTVVVLAQTCGTGFAADCLCPAITFHSHQSGAENHLSRHPELTGLVLCPDVAVDLARWSFGGLLAEDVVPPEPGESR